MRGFEIAIASKLAPTVDRVSSNNVGASLLAMVPSNFPISAFIELSQLNTP
jgi:hypothetical protein